MMMNILAFNSASRRLNILTNWIMGKRNGVPFFDLAKVVFGRTYISRAKDKISNIIDDQDYLIVYLDGMKFPLYYPKELSLHFLYAVISESCYEDNWHYYEAPETRVASDDIILDCGAAEGLFSLQAVLRCKHIYCVEPMPIYNDSLKRTFMNLKNVTIIPIALSDIKSKGFVSNMATGSKIDESNGYPIEINTIDAVFNNIPISYIKADLEGNELKMLLGAKDTILKNNPKIAITTYHAKEHAEMIAKYLRSLNPNYNIRLKGLEPMGVPTMLHAWVS